MANVLRHMFRFAFEENQSASSDQTTIETKNQKHSGQKQRRQRQRVLSSPLSGNEFPAEIHLS